jgi:hypothetical protein
MSAGGVGRMRGASPELHEYDFVIVQPCSSNKRKESRIINVSIIGL